MLSTHAVLAPGILPDGAAPHRPVAIAPSLALNSLVSLSVPAATYSLMVNLSPRERRWIPMVFVVIMICSVMVGALQFAGSAIDNPLINESRDQVSATFANRNHFALFMACGCLIVPAAIFSRDAFKAWQAPAAIGLTLTLILMILASGSRAGLALGVCALILSPSLVWNKVMRAVRRYPRWLTIAIVCGAASLLIIVIVISISSQRAVSIDRLFSDDVNSDMRRRGLSTVLLLVRNTPFAGFGAGSFDTLFRFYEPFNLLKPTYFNHAHNDFIEIFLDFGYPGVFLLLAALSWFCVASLRVWKRRQSVEIVHGRLGSAIIFLILLASLVDYPARTPMIMALLVIAGVWLAEGAAAARKSALPPAGDNL